MKWREIKTEKGILKYRLPNIEEGFAFLALIDTVRTLQDGFRIKGSFIPKMKDLVDYKALAYESYEDFLDDTENNFYAMAQIADEVFGSIMDVLLKKRTSVTRSQPPKTDLVETSSSDSLTEKQKANE